MSIHKPILVLVLGAGVLVCGIVMSACFPDMVVVEPPSLTLDDDPTGYDEWLGSPSAWTCDESDTGSPAAWGSGDMIVDLPRSYGNPSAPAGASLEELRALRESLNRAEKAKEAAEGSDRSPGSKESEDRHHR
ncbi:MAG: hypothetical protein JW885_00630 [Deltaproteobacteria bacterium]|nr:hypothetical protein [Candidatus Zymogenaceae bacterium]